MYKEDIISKKAPKAIGPYSQAVKTGRWVFCSGQLGIDPKTDKFKGNDIRSQTIQVFENLKQVLFSAGADLIDVVKVTIYLKDMSDYEEMNKIYEKQFQSPFPARATVSVSKLPSTICLNIRNAAADIIKGIVLVIIFCALVLVK